MSRSQPKQIVFMLLWSIAVLSSMAGGAHASENDTDTITPVYQEKQCMERGWQRTVLQVSGVPRVLLWKAPTGPWRKGAIIVLHGGGGEHFQWCVANARVVKSQVNFSELALAEGFAVFLLNSSDRVTDNAGRVCGKIWDDEVRKRANLDLPFIGEVISAVIPAARPEGSRKEIFLTGLSSGGYMTVRAATHFDDRVTAFAPVSSGDPYGWHRVCEAGMTLRKKVHGAGFDNETGKQIIEIDSCKSTSYPNEKSWDSTNPATKPPFRIFRHAMDGINDRSCGEKVGASMAIRANRILCCRVGAAAWPTIYGWMSTIGRCWIFSASRLAVGRSNLCGRRSRAQDQRPAR